MPWVSLLLLGSAAQATIRGGYSPIAVSLPNPLFLKVVVLYLLLWCALQLMQPVAIIYLRDAMHLPTAGAQVS